MNTIKKTTLIAVITAMAAFAVPSMASAATWAPAVPTLKTLTSTSPAVYYIYGSGNEQYSFTCSNSSLGVRARNPASSTLDITSASFTNCFSSGGFPCGTITVTATGLPWTATASGGNVTITEHLLVDEHCLYGTPITVDGPTSGTYNNATHTLSARATTTMYAYMIGQPIGRIDPTGITTWHETTNTLTLT